MGKLAINGGNKVRRNLFPPYKVIGEQEIRAVGRVIKSGALSKFLGTWHDNFYGGPQIRGFEKEWASFFKVKYAIAVNSATSGLFCAIGATGVGPGDEVIVSPYTMTASAIAPLIFNAIPVFADIEADYFCLDVNSVEKKITKRTKAIIVVDLFGQPYNVVGINTLAEKHNLIVIEDSAQAGGAKYKGRSAGTLADMGVYSLNYHKHIHSGEGGLVVTNDRKLADKLLLIRNHAEAVIDGKGHKSLNDLVNMVGFNYRMTEIEAAIGRQQLKKLSQLISQRQDNVAYLTEKLSSIPCLKPAKTRRDCTHSFYLHPIKFDSRIAGIHRDKFVEAVQVELPVTEGRDNEGVRIGCGYVKPLYLQPIYQHKIAYGKRSCPWDCAFSNSNVDYSKGICPVAEELYEDKLITHELMHPGMKKNDLDDVVTAFMKVYDNRKELS